ncbi:uncharacterized protein [Dendrobates tinctorius]|uniref:uncharacterized protein isoform X1 n=1 Tax=Dendrobates tinctorius TaxID=92724 RepID=UPI003CC9E5BC
MDMDRDKMAERILPLTLEILFRLTGEDYTVVKKTSSERCQDPVSEGWGRPLNPTTGPPPHPLIHEDINDQKILQLIYKMIELLTGEFPIRCQDVAVYFSMEEWEYLEGHKDLYKDVMMEVPQPLTSPDLSSKRTTPARCSRPLLPQDCKQEDPSVAQDHQGEDLTHFNTTETYVRGDERCKEEIPTYDYPVERNPREGPDRQYHRSGLYKPTRRYAIGTVDVYHGKDPRGGRGTSSLLVGTPHKRSGQLSSRLSQSTGPISGRVGPQQARLRDDSVRMGQTRDRPVRDQSQQTCKKVCFALQVRQPRHSRCPPSTLDIPASLCLPSNGSAANSSQENKTREGEGHLDSPVLAQEAVVFLAESHVDNRPVDPAAAPGSSLAGTLLPSTGQSTTTSGLEFERELLKQKGFSKNLINTLLQSRKESSTTKIYAKVWRKFLTFHPAALAGEPPITAILEVLQRGRELGLSVNTLKVHISALGALFNYNVAANRWVTRFVSACQRSEPVHIPRLPAWDLTLVLDAFTQAPFEPIDSASVKCLSLKTATLVALVSARRLGDLHALSIDPPFLSITRDRLILKTDPSYLPKRVTKFHRSQEICLPSFYENPSNQDEVKYHTLDVRRAVLAYLDRTSPWRQSRSLFVSFQGNRKGSGVTTGTLSRWIRDAIIMAYLARGEEPPLGIKAHSTRAISSSWAERANVPIEQICKAATWSSSSTFYSHYRLDLSSTEDLSFGRSVLNTVCPPK